MILGPTEQETGLDPTAGQDPMEKWTPIGPAGNLISVVQTVASLQKRLCYPGSFRI